MNHHLYHYWLVHTHVLYTHIVIPHEVMIIHVTALRQCGSELELWSQLPSAFTLHLQHGAGDWPLRVSGEDAD